MSDPGDSSHWPLADASAATSNATVALDRGAAREVYRRQLQAAYQLRLESDARRMQQEGLIVKRNGYEPGNRSITVEGVTIELRVPIVILREPIPKQLKSGATRLVQQTVVPEWDTIRAEVNAEATEQLLALNGTTRQAAASSKTAKSGRRGAGVSHQKIATVRQADREERAARVEGRPLEPVTIVYMQVDGTKVGDQTIIAGLGFTSDGGKFLAGTVKSDREDPEGVERLFRGLVKRGADLSHTAFAFDGGDSLRIGVAAVIGKKPVQNCVAHVSRNVGEGMPVLAFMGLAYQLDHARKGNAVKRGNRFARLVSGLTDAGHGEAAVFLTEHKDQLFSRQADPGRVRALAEELRGMVPRRLWEGWKQPLWAAWRDQDFEVFEGEDNDLAFYPKDERGNEAKLKQPEQPHERALRRLKAMIRTFEAAGYSNGKGDKRAAASLANKLEESVTLLRLGVGPDLLRRLYTTNAIESMFKDGKKHARDQTGFVANVDRASAHWESVGTRESMEQLALGVIADCHRELAVALSDGGEVITVSRTDATIEPRVEVDVEDGIAKLLRLADSTGKKVIATAALAAARPDHRELFERHGFVELTADRAGGGEWVRAPRSRLSAAISSGIESAVAGPSEQASATRPTEPAEQHATPGTAPLDHAQASGTAAGSPSAESRLTHAAQLAVGRDPLHELAGGRGVRWCAKVADRALELGCDIAHLSSGALHERLADVGANPGGDRLLEECLSGWWEAHGEEVVAVVAWQRLDVEPGKDQTSALDRCRGLLGEHASQVIDRRAAQVDERTVRRAWDHGDPFTALEEAVEPWLDAVAAEVALASEWRWREFVAAAGATGDGLLAGDARAILDAEQSAAGQLTRDGRRLLGPRRIRLITGLVQARAGQLEAADFVSMVKLREQFVSALADLDSTKALNALRLEAHGRNAKETRDAELAKIAAQRSGTEARFTQGWTRASARAGRWLETLRANASQPIRNFERLASQRECLRDETDAGAMDPDNWMIHYSNTAVAGILADESLRRLIAREPDGPVREEGGAEVPAREDHTLTVADQKVASARKFELAGSGAAIELN